MILPLTKTARHQHYGETPLKGIQDKSCKFINFDTPLGFREYYLI